MGEAKKARPVSIGFFDLFITQKPRPDELLQRHDSIGRDASGRLALVRHRKKVNFINCIRRFVTALLNQSITPMSLTGAGAEENQSFTSRVNQGRAASVTQG